MVGNMIIHWKQEVFDVCRLWTILVTLSNVAISMMIIRWGPHFQSNPTWLQWVDSWIRVMSGQYLTPAEPIKNMQNIICSAKLGNGAATIDTHAGSTADGVLCNNNNNNNNNNNQQQQNNTTTNYGCGSHQQKMGHTQYEWEVWESVDKSSSAQQHANFTYKIVQIAATTGEHMSPIFTNIMAW